MDNYVFDATQVDPTQSDGVHPVGKFDAVISNTEVVPTKNNDGRMFVITYTTAAGSVKHRLNLWNASSQAAEIANRQLSSVCHATGVYRVTMPMGVELRNARLQIEVGWQGSEQKYTEVKKVYDAGGNEPKRAGGAAPASAPQPPQNYQPPAPQSTPMPTQGWPQGNAGPSVQGPSTGPLPQGSQGYAAVPQPLASPQPTSPQPQQNWGQQPQPGATPPWGQQ